MSGGIRVGSTLRSFRREAYESATANTDVMHASLYDRVAQMAGQHTGASVAQIAELKDACNKTHDSLSKTYPELQTMQTASIETKREQV